MGLSRPVMGELYLVFAGTAKKTVIQELINGY
jgi:hypothetical protein